MNEDKYIEHRIHIGAGTLHQILRGAGYDIPEPTIHIKPNKRNAHKPKHSYYTVTGYGSDWICEHCEERNATTAHLNQIVLSWTTVYPGKQE